MTRGIGSSEPELASQEGTATGEPKDHSPQPGVPLRLPAPSCSQRLRKADRLRLNFTFTAILPYLPSVGIFLLTIPRGALYRKGKSLSSCFIFLIHTRARTHMHTGYTSKQDNAAFL